MTPPGPRILLGVTGGIAAYKSAEIIRRLRDLGCDVTVAATASASKFIGEATWAALSGKPVLTSLWQRADVVGHVSVARSVDAILVAPATADLLARLAQGRSDDVLGAIVLMAHCPIVIAPAMHTEMWSDAATQRNVRTLRAAGMLVLEPASGRLTGPDDGPGRLPAPESLADIIYCAAHRPAGADLSGVRVLVSAGGTREAWDPVRWLGNRSSGRMGYAVAAAAVARGAEVVVVSANVSLPDVAGAQTIAVTNHAELAQAVIAESTDCDAVVMAAAVSDFSIDARGDKVKKSPGQVPTLTLQPTADILAGLGASREGTRPLLVGFAAETETDPQKLSALAHSKLLSKGCDAVVANDVSGSAVFGEDHASVIIASRNNQDVEIRSQHKLDIGHAVCGVIAQSTR